LRVTQSGTEEWGEILLEIELILTAAKRKKNFESLDYNP